MHSPTIVAFATACLAPAVAFAQVLAPEEAQVPAPVQAPWGTANGVPVAPAEPTAPPWVASTPPFAMPPQGPPPGTVPLRFVRSEGGDDFDVAVGEQRCHVPCTLYLPPGHVRVLVSRDRGYLADWDVPAGPSVVVVHGFHPGRMVTGVLGLVGGGLA